MAIKEITKYVSKIERRLRPIWMRTEPYSVDRLLTKTITDLADLEVLKNKFSELPKVISGFGASSDVNSRLGGHRGASK